MKTKKIKQRAKECGFEVVKLTKDDGVILIQLKPSGIRDSYWFKRMMTRAGNWELKDSKGLVLTFIKVVEKRETLDLEKIAKLLESKGLRVSSLGASEIARGFFEVSISAAWSN